MTRENLAECKPVTFTQLEIKERADLQHVLRDHIEVLGGDLRVIAEEYGNWEDSRRRIDLFALDKQQRRGAGRSARQRVRGQPASARSALHCQSPTGPPEAGPG